VPADERDAVDRKRMLVLVLVVWPLFMSTFTVWWGMRRIWPFWLGFVPMAAVLIGYLLMARVLVGPGWTRFLSFGQAASTRGAFLSLGLNWLGMLIAFMIGESARGDLPVLVLGGLAAGAPLLAFVAVRHWWWRPRVAARARRDDDPDPG
jgi:hypothetical protein